LIRILRITGVSLTPKYQPGDYIFVITWMDKRKLKPGDVVVFRQPAYGTLVKKIQTVNPERETCWLVGTVPESVDSNEFGDVSFKNIIGKVVAHFNKRY
jgi:nickel-type superoxide dismutase maturation protease